MTRTPWGHAHELRTRKLAPGYRLPADVVARHQRERLMAAMVASVAEHGYEATTVAHLLELSGVSRAAFYQLFGSKEDCFVAVVEEVRDLASDTMWRAYDEADGGRVGLERAFAAAAAMALDQTPTARLYLTELYTAQPSTVEQGFRVIESIGTMVREAIAAEEGEELPDHIAHGLAGGLYIALYARLRAGDEAGLPVLAAELAEWIAGYRAPSAPLRRPRPLTRRGKPPAPPAPPSDEPVDRILFAYPAALVETRYGDLRLEEIVQRAHVSFRTFYVHFESKGDAFLAAHRAGVERVAAAVDPAFAGAPDWPQAMRGALRALVDFYAAEPGWVQLSMIDALAAGPAAVERRDATIAGIAELLEPGFELSPSTPAVAAEAIAGAIHLLIYESVLHHGTEQLPELLPTLAYIALAPFVGAEAATELANERPAIRLAS